MKALKVCIMLAVFAACAVVPSIASATNDPLVTVPTGTVPTPSHEKPLAVTATNVGNLVMTDVNTNPLITCHTATFTGHLETNTVSSGGATGALEGTITTAEVSGHREVSGKKTHCDGGFLAGAVTVTTEETATPNGTPWCILANKTMPTNGFQVRGNSCTKASRPITFILDTGTIGKCNYQRTDPISGTYTTHPNALQMSIDHVEFKKESTSGESAFCPATGYLDMTFALTSGGQIMYIDNQDKN